MQKKLIALAIAGLTSTAAFAQTNVTLYGVADVSLESVATSNNAVGDNRGNSGRVNSNDSFVGFKGTEDLGDGMKALFQFETGFAADAGTYNGSGRDTFVGLSSGFGTVTAGNLTTATRALGVRMEMLPGNAGVGTADSLLGQTGRLSNAIQYQSNDFNGFNFSAAYGFGEDKKLNSFVPVAPVIGNENFNNSKTYDIGLNYAIGGFDLGYAYSHFDSGSNFAADIDTGKNHLIGVGYTFDGGHKVTAQFEKTKTSIIGGGDADRNGYSLQGLFKVTPAGSVIGEYTVARDVSGTSDTGAKMYTVGYVHNLSKRTLVKALYSKINNENNSIYDFANSPVSIDPLTSVGYVGADPRAFSVGMRHAF